MNLFSPIKKFFRYTCWMKYEIKSEMSGSQEELEQTYEALKMILEDDDTFGHVCAEVFKTIDIDGSGSLERTEIRNFINNMCSEMGMKSNPDDKTIQEVFAELDEDGSNDISTEELKGFLRKLFVSQRDEVGKALGKK